MERRLISLIVPAEPVEVLDGKVVPHFELIPVVDATVRVVPVGDWLTVSGVAARGRESRE